MVNNNNKLDYESHEDGNGPTCVFSKKKKRVCCTLVVWERNKRKKKKSKGKQKHTFYTGAQCKKHEKL